MDRQDIEDHSIYLRVFNSHLEFEILETLLFNLINLWLVLLNDDVVVLWMRYQQLINRVVLIARSTIDYYHIVAFPVVIPCTLSLIVIQWKIDTRPVVITFTQLRVVPALNLTPRMQSYRFINTYLELFLHSSLLSSVHSLAARVIDPSIPSMPPPLFTVKLI